ncbi:MBL fold metallo-hydrolase [Flaviaesturariibacter flavus]|uniref:MBL fold metallo-hydrolase n=1 Tax=Flaviaesturariibacter flavus TaxID=2502780 RepID=A0A4R1B9J2_9BACT|nr:MBL fold metallo-hydrolase [Flaviaesturariibacter flavus]TCJ13568.1 MBL fold metallo-hydrolase [Flaviaesturariibacter flavus]
MKQFATAARTLLRHLLLALLLLASLGGFTQVTALTTATAPSGNMMDVYFLDVAQGNCVLIKLPNGKFMLYDAGSTSSKIDKNVVAGRIRTITGGAQISTVFLSHADADHINILPYITEAAKPTFVHISGQKSDYEDVLDSWIKNLPKNTTWVTYGPNYSSTKPSSNIDGDPMVNVYVMAANVTGDANTQSLVISLDYGKNNALLTGDATQTTENFILSQWASSAVAATIFSFGHHGSNHSSSPQFITAVNPNIGVFSASAEHMGYGHPRCELLNYVQGYVDANGKNGVTIQSHQIDCWRSDLGNYVFEHNDLGVFLTATQGDIRFRCDGVNYMVEVSRL